MPRFYCPTPLPLGAALDLPEDAIVESPGFVDRFGINMVDRPYSARVGRVSVSPR